MRHAISSAIAIAASVPFVIAQTSTTCNPTEQSCPSDPGLNSGSYSADFTSGSSTNASWSAAAYTYINYGSSGAEFTISQAGQAPTIQTDFYFLFGRVDVKMKAAPGTGIISSIVFESDDLDEIDWEFLGGNTTQCETNFFGKGNTTAYDRAVWYNVATPQTTFHTYTLDWNADRIEWIIDGTTVRTLEATDPLTAGGMNYPQTPMRLKLGNWAAGGPGEPEGTVQWAGGNTTFDDGPFTMYVESVSIQNNDPACSYTYGDNSGSWQSIHIDKTGCSIDSSSSSGSSGSAPSSTASATSGSVSESASAGSATFAPTSSLSVAPISVASGAAVASTVIGSSYSMNSASASAENTNGATAGSGSTTTRTIASATTEAPGAAPTGSGSLGGSNATASLASSTSSGPGESTSTSGASAAKSFVAAGSLMSAAMFLFTL